jgi:mRNA interferase RelE/StbE
VNVVFERSFSRDLKRIKDAVLLKRVKEVIEAVQAAETLDDVQSVRKMRGYEQFYRIRLGDYWIGFELDNEQVIFVRILHRKDIYRYFP